MQTGIYLGRSGKPFGPYSPEELESFKRSGKLKEFTWIWDEENRAWNPIDPPPPPISASAKKTAPAREASPSTTLQAEPQAAPQHQSLLQLEAICHDRQSAISGRLRLVTDSGCEFISPHPIAEPPFGQGVVVLLNLLDPASGKSVDTQAKIASIGRKDGIWTYQLQWKQCPDLIHESIMG